MKLSRRPLNCDCGTLSANDLSKVDDDVKRRGEGTDEAELVLAGQKVTGSLVSKFAKKLLKYLNGSSYFVSTLPPT